VSKKLTNEGFVHGLSSINRFAEEASPKDKTRVIDHLVREFAKQTIQNLDHPGRPRFGNAVAIELLTACRDVGIPPPSELVDLCAQALNVKVPSLENPFPNDIPAFDPLAWGRAVEFEAQHPESDNAPSTGSLKSVALAAGVDRKTARKWRCSERYIIDVMWARLVLQGGGGI
jgi:hypothetical protein